MDAAPTPNAEPSLGQRPLGEVVFVAQVEALERSTAMHDAVINLVSKSIAALERGDRDRAEALLLRAQALPLDQFEQDSPEGAQLLRDHVAESLAAVRRAGD